MRVNLAVSLHAVRDDVRDVLVAEVVRRRADGTLQPHAPLLNEAQWTALDTLLGSHPELRVLVFASEFPVVDDSPRDAAKITR